MLRLRGVVLTVALAVCSAVTACGGNRGTAIQQLESRNPTDRVQGIIALTQAGNGDAGGGGPLPSGSVVPLFVDRLEDEDEAVRFYAILALEKLTGTRLGYRYGDPVDLRRRAIERWRRYTSAGSTAGAESETATTQEARP